MGKLTDMSATKQERLVYKETVLKDLNQEHVSYLNKYNNFFVGPYGVSYLVKFELITTLCNPMPGGLGILLRKCLYPRIFKRVGSGALWGRNIALRHPAKIEIGDRVAVDDNCLLDARGTGAEGIQIGNDVMIARDSIIQGKGGWIRVGDSCIIGSKCQLYSIGGIKVGNYVMIAGQCYIGGGRYRYDDRDTPIANQALFTKGPVVIEDDVWLGASVTVLDGVRIGKGSVIGSGTVVREDVPEYTVVTPHQKLVILPRGLS